MCGRGLNSYEVVCVVSCGVKMWVARERQSSIIILVFMVVRCPKAGHESMPARHKQNNLAAPETLLAMGWKALYKSPKTCLILLANIQILTR